MRTRIEYHIASLPVIQTRNLDTLPRCLGPSVSLQSMGSALTFCHRDPHQHHYLALVFHPHPCSPLLHLPQSHRSLVHLALDLHPHPPAALLHSPSLASVDQACACGKEYIILGPGLIQQCSLQCLEDRRGGHWGVDLGGLRSQDRERRLRRLG